MTSQFPAHPAGSFNYPHLDRLPTLAVYQLTKVKYICLVVREALIHVWFQLREYTLQEQDDAGTNTLQEQDKTRTDLKEEKKKNYSATNRNKSSIPKENNQDHYSAVESKDAFDFISVTTKDNKKSLKSEIVSNEIPIPEKPSSYSHKKRKVGLFGSKPSSGFRSSSSLGGYHASTSPENFFKKKYKSAHLKKAQRRVVSGSLDGVPKSELYQHIMAQYKKGGIRRKKKTLRKRKQRRHRSKS